MVTVLTATYNREKLLPKLFESLLIQTCRDFNWIIIDDGSTDNTKELVKIFKSKADFEIIYKYKENGGKHRALNFAYQFINNSLTFIVDSDDYLTNDAIEVIKETYLKYQFEKDLCGFSFLRGKPAGGYLSTTGVPRDGLKETFVECRINRNIGGDMAEVWYTHCLKEYKFPEIEGEKFLGEDIIWLKMSKKYKIRFFNKVIYISGYLDNGLTKNRRKHNINSPIGCVIRADTFLRSDCSIKAKTKAALQYQIYGRFAKIRLNKLFMSSNKKILFCLVYLPSLFIYMHWKSE